MLVCYDIDLPAVNGADGDLPTRAGARALAASDNAVI
jgi:hypothetical protein